MRIRRIQIRGAVILAVFAVASGNKNISKKRRRQNYKAITVHLDRQGPCLMTNVCHFLGPPYFSLYTTFHLEKKTYR